MIPLSHICVSTTTFFSNSNYASVAIAKLTAKAAMYVGLFVPHKKVGRNNTTVASRNVQHCCNICTIYYSWSSAQTGDLFAL